MTTSVGSKAIFAGGHLTPTYSHAPAQSDQIDIYDIVTGQWTTATLSLPREGGAATSIGSKAFFAGGSLSFNGERDEVDIYDLTANQWTTAKLSSPRSSLAATSLDHRIFFAGGFNQAGISPERDIVDIYNNVTNQWTTATLSQGRFAMAATSLETKVLFAGGEISRDKVDIYDATTNQWTTASLSEARSNLAATSSGSKAFFAGGQIPDYSGGPVAVSASSRVDIYDAVTNQWTTASLSKARRNLSAAALGNLLFFAGGYGSDNQPSDVVDIYDLTTSQWSTAQLPTTKGPLSAVKVGNKILFAGDGSSNVDIYTLDAALPVNLTTFSGQWLEATGTQLHWATSWETNNDHFEVQRSADAKSFETIGRLAGKGTTNEHTEYSFTDDHMPEAINYYRLKQVDLDGSVHLSNIISVSHQPDNSSAKLSVWPSPATGPLTLQLSSGKAIQQVTVYDLHGRKLSSQLSPQSTVDVSGLPTGAYILDVLTQDGQHQRSRFVKQ
ncbi:T9SS C-terminal target domain-containing protein [Spirosoma sp. KNUC1025]|uniref:T9SS C-terminal target domain-containing protein n=1 Tax=Spirosoma sp. KNUC1025 TaxID=2894082 RepID=UPI00386E4AFA|nr:T9SS type A sorting domain-containing protein [Spirosoma sp. KNUC1025]